MSCHRANPAAVYWVTGLAGAGKSTIGRALHQRLVAGGRAAVFLDGDELRAALGDVHGHGIDDRRYLAGCYARLCRLLAGQGVDVVCATVSMFDSVRRWNRDNIAGYVEIYVTAPPDVLRRRRSLYTEAPSDQVVGLRPGYELPRSPDLVIANDGTADPAALADRIPLLCPADPTEESA